MTVVDVTVVPLDPEDQGRPQPASRQPRRDRRPPRWLQLTAAGAAVVALFGYVIIKGGGDTNPVAGPAPGSSSINAAAPTGPVGWRWQLSACGGLVEPKISSTPLTQKTGIRVFVAGSLRTLNLDSGNVGAVSQVGLRPGELVVDAAVGTAGTVLLAASCADGASSDRVIRVDDADHVLPGPRGRIDQIFDGGQKVWGVKDPASIGQPSIVVPMDGDPAITLPVGITPIGAYGDTIVGLRSGDSAIAEEIVLFDTVGQKVAGAIGARSTSGPADPSVDPATLTNLLMVDRGYVLWTEAPCGGPVLCIAHRHNLETSVSVTLGLRFPAGRALRPLAVSADGGTLAGRLTRSLPNRRFRDDFDDGAPSDLVQVDLASSKVTTVPGIQLEPRSAADVTFSNDGRWMVIGLSVGIVTRVLVWHIDLPKPLEVTAPLTAGSSWAPIISLLS